MDDRNHGQHDCNGVIEGDGRFETSVRRYLTADWGWRASTCSSGRVGGPSCCARHCALRAWRGRRYQDPRALRRRCTASRACNCIFQHLLQRHVSGWCIWRPWEDSRAPCSLSALLPPPSLLIPCSAHTHLTCAERCFRRPRQCVHCDTGRPFLLMCCKGRSEKKRREGQSALQLHDEQGCVPL